MNAGVSVFVATIYLLLMQIYSSLRNVKHGNIPDFKPLFLSHYLLAG